MIVIVCAGGPKEELCDLAPYIKMPQVTFIGADRGAYHLLDNGIVPDVVVGDFDSVTEQEWEQLSRTVHQIDKFQAEKDETDTDLALLKALTFEPNEIIITGVTGGRLDHYEAALRSVCHLQLDYPHITFKIANSRNEIRFLKPGTHQLAKNEKFSYVSFFAHTYQVDDVTLRGVKYETKRETMSITSTRFTSNEIIEDNAYIEFTSGICLMIRSVD